LAIKKKIYLIVGLLVAVALTIGLVSILSLDSLDENMETGFDLTLNHSYKLKSLKADIDLISLSIREVVLHEGSEEMKTEKEKIDTLIKNNIDPMLSTYKPTPQNAST
jgi:hypothetical protein